MSLLSASGRRLARELLPPLALRPLRRLYRRLTGIAGLPPEWATAGHEWPAEWSSNGWDEKSVADAQATKWPAFLRLTEAPLPLAVAHEADAPTNDDVEAHNTIMCFAYALARASSGASRVSVLDWGGGLGHYARLAKVLFPDLDIDYHCHDLPRLVARGRSIHPGVTFHDSELSWRGRQFDLVVASGSLHCVPDWRAQLSTLAAASQRYLFLSRLPIVAGRSIAATQRPRLTGYDSPLRCWLIGRRDILAAASATGCVLEREFFLGQGFNPPLTLDITERAFLFAPAPTL